MTWVTEQAARLEEYRNMEYGGQEQARKVVLNYEGKYVDGEYALSVASVPKKLHEDFAVALNYRMEACVNLANGRGWPAEVLRRAT